MTSLPKPRLGRNTTPLRRGNTIVLVTGILVLLVIIATAYVTRTQAGRVSAGAAQSVGLHDDTVNAIADSLSQIPASALFPVPVKITFGVQDFDSNVARLPVKANAVRYGRDPLVAFNFAPYEVVGWTNPPDPASPGYATLGLTATRWPKGPGNNFNPTSVFLLGEGNPIGNPGFGDTRWLSDNEPLRFYDTINLDGVPDLYSHYRHLSYLATVGNGWRLAANISNVDASLVVDLNLPVEQWLPVPPDNLFSASGDPAVPANFDLRWQQWFGFNPALPGLKGYEASYVDPTMIPMNHYHLRDLDGDNIWNEVGERPQDEFVAGTLRWRVSRVLADTNGDGWTDAFWFYPPSSVNAGIRQVVAVSIIDNGGMINVGTAGRFLRNEVDFQPGTPLPATGRKTRGLGPWDVSLTAQNNTIPPTTSGSAVAIPSTGTFSVGFLDNPWHWHIGPDALNTEYRATYWDAFQNEVGFIKTAGIDPAPNTLDRLGYWQEAGSRPLSSLNFSKYSPFTLADEIELRMYAGQNYPWNFSRLEKAFFNSGVAGGSSFLHASTAREESSEYLNQLSNIDLAHEYRKDITVYNATRNDIMPPWLWKVPNTPERKLDLRRADLTNTVDLDGSGTVDLIDARLRLRNVIEQAFIEPEGLPQIPNPTSYFGAGAGNLDKSRELSASLTANIWQWRDRNTTVANAPEVSPLSESVPVSVPTGGPPTNARFMGIEPQPFLVEAFIGHVYKPFLIPVQDSLNHFYLASDVNKPVILDAADHETTVVVVQVANPFNRPLDLSKHRISVCGQNFDFPANSILAPGTDDKPATAIVYAMDPAFDTAFAPKWMNFLDLELPVPAPPPPAVAQLTNNTLLFNANQTTAVFSASRGVYDTFTGSAIEISREDPNQPGTFVVIDRFDPPGDRQFGDALNQMQTEAPAPAPVPSIGDGLGQINNDGEPYPIGIKIGQNYTHWVQWRRVTRAWGVDLNNNGFYNQNEKSPRYVFGDRTVTKSAGVPVGDPDVDGPTFIGEGDRYKFDQADPNTPVWFTRDYFNLAGLVVAHKPTFFNMNKGADPVQPPNPPNGNYPLGWSYPDKGWYSQPGGVDTTPVGNIRLNFAMQMLQKDSDFEQLGELYNIWMYGHKIDATQGALPGQFTYNSTTTTFSEYLAKPNDNIAGTGFRVNRLSPLGATIPDLASLNGLNDPRVAYPALPAWVRLLDAFVCDGAGANTYAANDPDNLGSFLLAKGYDGSGTPGLINLNTASVAVNQAMPNWARLVHETGLDWFNNQLFNGAGQKLVTDGSAADALLPRTMIPEALWHYRERFNGDVTPPPGQISTGVIGGANYENRLGARGLHSTAEMLLLTQPGQAATGVVDVAAVPLVLGGSVINDRIYNQYWKLDMGVTSGNPADPFPFLDAPGSTGSQATMRVSTDRVDEYDAINSTTTPTLNTLFRPDTTAGDVEEANMLFSGASNMVTTRSDTFTIYFRVRSFRQNTSVVPPVWDATNPEYIVDDSRYVMLVDRSSVNRPSDKPKILYMEKLPN